MNERNKPHRENDSSLTISKKNILRFIRLTAKKHIKLPRPWSYIYLTRLRLGLSPFHKRKFKNNFQDTLNPLSTCGCDVKTRCHFLLHSTPYQVMAAKYVNVSMNGTTPYGKIPSINISIVSLKNKSSCFVICVWNTKWAQSWKLFTNRYLIKKEKMLLS